MASKTATTFIIDVGETMGDCHNGRTISDLDYGMQYVWDKMATIMANSRKGDNIGVFALRSDGTNNGLSEGGEEDEYAHISVLKQLSMLEMGNLRNLQEDIKISSTTEGDAISAIVVAGEAIKEFTTLKTGKPGAYTRTIILVTDGEGAMNGDDIPAIAARLNELKIGLTVVGIDFDSENPEFVEEDKSATKRQNEALLKQLAELVTGGLLGTAAEVIESMLIPTVKEGRPIKSYEGMLQLGDPEKYPDAAVQINVCRVPKTKIAKPVSASKFANDEGTENLSSVKNSVTYSVQDSSSGELKWKDVERDELSKGYMYGRTVVPFTEEEAYNLRSPSKKSFTIIGFVPAEKYDRFLTMGESSITYAPTSDNTARLALSSFVHALHETESYAVARLVLKDDKDPQIILLAPSITVELEALVDVVLPFAEDIRTYQFPPLDKVITTKGDILTKHRNLPSDDLVDAMSNYVDSMDLSKFGEDDEGNPAEYMTFEETFSPVIHRINQAIKHRAMYPEDPVEKEAAEVLTKWSHPPADLVSQSAKELEKLVKVAAVKQVEEKKKGKRSRESVKPKSNLNIDDLLKGEKKRTKISSENAIPEFKQMCTYEGNDVITDAADQLGAIIRARISGSGSDETGVEIAISQMRVMRKQLVELEVPEAWNGFIQDLKKRLVEKKLGQNVADRDLWQKIVSYKLGLITNSEQFLSKVSEDDAAEFLKLPSPLAVRVKSDASQK